MKENAFQALVEDRKVHAPSLTGDRLTEAARVAFLVGLPELSRPVRVWCSLLEKPLQGDMVIIALKGGENMIGTLAPAPDDGTGLFLSRYGVSAEPVLISKAEIKTCLQVVDVARAFHWDGNGRNPGDLVEYMKPSRAKPPRKVVAKKTTAKDELRACTKGKKRMKRH